MQSDFFNAFKRHWNDAEYLYADARWANADQLYAYSAECGLKCLMRLFGMAVDPDGNPLGSDKAHVNIIWERYEAYRAGGGSTDYILPHNPFSNWDVSNRYANENNFNPIDVQLHRIGTDLVRKLIDKAVLDGRLIT